MGLSDDHVEKEEHRGGARDMPPMAPRVIANEFICTYHMCEYWWKQVLHGDSGWLFKNHLGVLSQ